MEGCTRRRRDGRITPLSERVCVIVNPASGPGRGATMLPAIRSAFAAYGVTEVRLTREWRDERKLAADAIAHGFTTIVAVGGDGTTANIANVILHSESDARLGVIPAGTGNDFAMVLGTDGNSMEMVARRAVQSGDSRVDVGRIEDTFFLNSCGFGFDVAVLQGLGQVRWLRGKAVYLYTALTQLFRFRGLHVTVETTLVSRRRSLHMMLLIANGPWFGGGIPIAPTALVTDGELDAIAVHDVSAFRRLLILVAVARGRHPRYAEVHIERAAGFTVAFDAMPIYEADGEIHQAKSASVLVRCIPGALRVVTGDAGLRAPRTPSIPAKKRRVKFAPHPNW